MTSDLNFQGKACSSKMLRMTPSSFFFMGKQTACVTHKKHTTKPLGTRMTPSSSNMLRMTPSFFFFLWVNKQHVLLTKKHTTKPLGTRMTPSFVILD